MLTPFWSQWVKQLTQESVEEDASSNISELYEKRANIWENHNYWKLHSARLFSNLERGKQSLIPHILPHPFFLLSLDAESICWW